MKIVADKRALGEIEADAALVFVLGQEFSHEWITDSTLLESLGFEGKAEQNLLDSTHRILYYALDKFDIDLLREASCKALRLLKKYPFKTVKCGVCDRQGKTLQALQAMMVGFLSGDYCFDAYKSKKTKSKLATIVFSLTSHSGAEIDAKEFERVRKECETMLWGVNFARDLINTIPDVATPDYLAQKAKKLADDVKMDCKIYDEHYLQKEGMNAFYAVSKASVHPPRLIHLHYKPKNPKLKIAVVGKGLTYDSGGLSLKPSDYMVTMKADKSGGCAALGIIAVLAKLGLDVEVHSIVGATENLIGGNAFKPDDVLTAKNGTTIEVRNTDAEGRLVLCDCLCYAQDFKPDYIIDLATLTGACSIAVGEYSTGVLGYNEKLKRSFIKAAAKSGEYAVSLPFNRHLRKMIDSKIADICNVGSARYGGAITAGLFLGEFIAEKYRDCWLHLDIAGPAYVEKEWDINPFGASGAGIRMVVEFIKKLLKDK
ncbi:MAG: leucyl aminopeptidase [Helicobacter sp.]|nr:leucyl aminopeptidase [Helicobacter sp.]